MEIGTAESVIPSPHLLCQIFNWKQQDESKKYVKGDKCSQSYCKVWSGATYLTLSKSLSRFAMLACALYPLSLVSLISHEFFHLQFSYHGSYSSYGLRYVSEDMESRDDLWGCLRALAITSSLSSNQETLTSLVFSNTTRCSDLSSMVHSVSRVPRRILDFIFWSASPYTRPASSSRKPHALVSCCNVKARSRTSSSLYWKPSSSSSAFFSNFVVLVFKT